MRTTLPFLLTICALSTGSCASRDRVPAWKGLSSRARPASQAPAATPVARATDPRPGAASGDAGLMARLSREMIPAIHVTDEESLRAVLEPVRNMTGLPIVVDSAAENAVLDAGLLFDFQLDHPISVRDFLNLVVRQASGDVAWVVRHDAVLVSTPDRAAPKPILVSHDVRDILFGRTDFSAPRIDRIRLLEELEDDDGGGPFGGVGERVTSIEADDLAVLVQENVAVGSWEDDGRSLQAENGFLLVVHEPAVQVEVRRLLDQLR